MKPHLLALNLNGMTRGATKREKDPAARRRANSISQLLRAIRDSGWRGPIGILNHTGEDAEARLLDNLDGLDWLAPQLDGKPAGAKPVPRSWKRSAPPPKGASRGEQAPVRATAPRTG